MMYIFLDKDCKKQKFLPAGDLWLFFISPSQWIGNKQLFIVGPMMNKFDLVISKFF